MWAKRYLCMVPHMFLYYFDSGNLLISFSLIMYSNYFLKI